MPGLTCVRLAEGPGGARNVRSVFSPETGAASWQTEWLTAHA
jgi:hypothetical protein